MVLGIPDDSRILRDGVWRTQKEIDGRRGLSGIAERFGVPEGWTGLAGEPHNAARLDGRNLDVIFGDEPWVVPGISQQRQREQERDREGREQLDEIERRRMLEQQRRAEEDRREAQEAERHAPPGTDSSGGAPAGRTILAIAFAIGVVLLIVHTGRGVGQWLQNRSARPRTRLVPDRADAAVERIAGHVRAALRWLSRLFTRHGPPRGGVTTVGKPAVLEEPGVEKYAVGRAVGRAVRAVLRKLQLRWAGPARAPPQDLEEVRTAAAERRSRLGTIDERRWSAEQRAGRDAAFVDLDRVVGELAVAPEGDRERLLADAGAALATLYRFTDKRLEFWRNGLSRSHRLLFLPIIAIAGGVANWGVYTMAVLSAGVVGIGPGMLFSVGFAGFVAGLLLWAPWSGWFSRRAMTIGSLLGMAAGFGWFALAGGTAGYAVAAFVLGLFTSGYVQLEAGVQRWVGITVGERRRGGEKLRLSDGITGLVYLGITFVLPAVLQMQELLLPAGLVTVAGVSAVVAAVAAIAALIVMPTMSPTRSVIGEDRRGWRRWATTWWQLTRSTFTVLKDPFVLSTALVFGLVAATIGAFDGLWRAMMPSSAHVVEAFYNFALMAGGVVLALSLIAADLRAGREKGPKKRQGLLERRPDAFMFTMAVVMAAGATANLVATLAGAPLLGIGLLAYLGEGSSTAMIVAVYAMLDRRVADGRLAAHLLPAAETATNFVKAIFQYGGAQLAALLVAAHPLPGGWPAVSVQNTTTAILTVGAAAWLWWYTARWPWLSRTVRAVSAVVRSLVRKLGPGDRDGLEMHWAVGVAGVIVTWGTVAAAAGLPTLWIDVTAVVGVAAMAVWALVQAVRAVWGLRAALEALDTRSGTRRRGSRVRWSVTRRAPPPPAGGVVESLLAAVTPEDVAALWEVLSAGDRERVKLHHRDRIRERDGIPNDVRDELNREFLVAVKAELAGTDPRLAGIRYIEDRLAVADRDGPRVLLLGVGIEGRGHATIAVGDPDTAAHVAVIVPGTGHGLNTAQVAIRQADEIWRVAAAADPASDTAIIVRWDDSPGVIRYAFSHGVARRGAPRLRAFLGGLRASRRGPPAHMTVVAHSYGTVLAGYAARVFGLPIDDLVLLASPGTTAGHVSELNMPAEHVWAGAATRDPIRFVPRGWHRISPMAPRFGAKIFPTGSGGTGGLAPAHYSYIQAGAPALPHIVAIVIGRGHQVPTAPRAISGFADHVDRRRVSDAALMDAVDFSLTPPVHRDDTHRVGWIFVGDEAMVVLDADGVVLAARPRSSLLGERKGRVVRRLVESAVQLRRTDEPAERHAARASRAPVLPGAGLQRPFASAGLPDDVARRLLGAEMSRPRRLGFADALDGPGLPLPASATGEVATGLAGWVGESAAVLRGEPIRAGGTGVRRVEFHELAGTASDERTGLPISAGHVVDSDGTLHIVAADAAGVVHELVEAVFAVRDGFDPAAAHDLGVLAERAVPGAAVTAESWLTRRAAAELAHLAAHHPRVLAVEIGRYEDVLIRINRLLRDRGAWRIDMMAFAADFRTAAIAAAVPAGGAARFSGNPSFRASAADRVRFAELSRDWFDEHRDAVLEAIERHPWLATIAIEELVAVRAYTGGWWAVEVNAALRGLDIRDMWGHRVLELLDGYLAVLVSGLNQFPTYDGVVRRSIVVAEGELPQAVERYQPGRIVVEPNVLSSNAAGPPFDGNIEFEIDSRTGRDVSAVQVYNRMSDGTPVVEVAFPPGSRFVVTDRRSNRGVLWRIGLRDLGDPAPDADQPGRGRSAVVIAGLAGTALVLPAAAGAAGRAAAEPIGAVGGAAWAEAPAGLLDAPIAVAAVVVAVAVGVWALLRFLKRQNAPPARRWERLAAGLRAQFGADDREVFTRAQHSLWTIERAHNAYRDARTRARWLPIDAGMWMGPVGQLALRDGLWPAVDPDGVPEVALRLVERDRALLAGFTDLLPVELRYAIEELRDVHRLLPRVLEMLSGWTRSAAVGVYRESMKLSDDHREQGVDEVLDEVEAAALELLRLLSRTGFLSLDRDAEHSVRTRLSAAATALAGLVPDERRVVALSAFAGIAEDISDWTDRTLTPMWQGATDHVDARLANEHLWSALLRSWAGRADEGPLRGLVTRYEVLRTVDELPTDVGEAAHLLAVTTTAVRKWEARLASRSYRLDDLRRYTDAAVEYARQYRRQQALAPVLEDLDPAADPTVLAAARARVQERLAAEMARLAADPALAREHRSAVVAYLAERRRARGETGRMSGAAPLGLAGLGLDGAPAGLATVVQVGLVIATLVWGFRALPWSRIGSTGASRIHWGVSATAPPCDGGFGPAATAPDDRPIEPHAVNGAAEFRSGTPTTRYIEARSRSPPPGRGPAIANTSAPGASDRADSAPRDPGPRDSGNGQRGSVPPAFSWRVADGHRPTGGN